MCATGAHRGIGAATLPRMNSRGDSLKGILAGRGEIGQITRDQFCTCSDSGAGTPRRHGTIDCSHVAKRALGAGFERNVHEARAAGVDTTPP